MKLITVVAPLSLLLLAQQQPLTPTYLESLEVTVGSLDVVVTDKAGVPVHGLRRNDFEVRENGEPQAITNFSEFGASSGTSELIAPAVATTATPPPAQAAVEAPPPRKFVFFIDEMSVHPKSRAKLLDTMHRLIESEMRPGDESMIVTPATQTAGNLAFTSDRSAVDAQLRMLIEKSGTRRDTPSRAEQFFYDTVVQRAGGEDHRQQAKIYATRVNRRVTSTLRALLGVVGSLTQVEGKKVLVVMSESLTAEPGREAFAAAVLPPGGFSQPQDTFSGRDEFDTNTRQALWFDARPMIAELGARATANGITIYSIQPDPGFEIHPPGSDAGTAAPKQTPLDALLKNASKPTAQSGVGAAAASVTSFQRDIYDGTARTLGSLADATGGKYWSGELELADAFKTIASDIDSYYSIGYRVATSTPDAIRKIAVTVKDRPELVVRTRRDVLRYSPDREMDEIAAASLLTAKEVNELGITAVAATPKRGHDSYSVDVAVKIPLEKLTFIPYENDKYRAQFSVHYAAADGANYTVGQMRQQTLQVPAHDIDFVRRKTYTYTSTLVVAPGTAKIAVGVFDKLSRLSGFQRLSVEAR